MSGFDAVIGLECHAQLATASKLFCACPVSADAPPNTAICEVCAGHPGTMPTLNDRAVKLAVRAALALGCTVHPVSVFARKHYFYPDLPKGYQVSQGARPLATGGRLHVGGRAFGITRIHLEEDAGRLFHEADGTWLDGNRAGVPLIEIVGEPDLRTPEEVEGWLRALHRVLVEGGICAGDLEKGQFRVDVNVSVFRPGEPWGPRVEVKNVNSFRFAAKAVRFEIERQVAEGARQETRTWTGTATAPLRDKEGVADYRWMDEPDLPPLRISAAELAAERDALPGVPLDLHLAERAAARLAELVSRHGLAERDAAAILADEHAAAFFAEAVAAGGEPVAMARWVTGEVARLRNEGASGRLRPADVVAVQRLLDEGAVRRDGARRLVGLLAVEEADPRVLIDAHGLGARDDEAAVRAAVADVFARHAEEVARCRAGQGGLRGFLVGRVMEATGRKADPRLVARLVGEALGG